MFFCRSVMFFCLCTYVLLVHHALCAPRSIVHRLRKQEKTRKKIAERGEKEKKRRKRREKEHTPKKSKLKCRKRGEKQPRQEKSKL